MKNHPLAFPVPRIVFIALAFAIFASGCGTAQISQEQTESAAASVDRASMIKVVHLCPPQKKGRECNPNAYEKPGLLFGAIGAIFAMQYYQACLESQRLQYMDVSEQIQNRFVENFNKRAPGKLSSVDNCVKTDRVRALEEQFGAIKVFDFKVTEWEQIEEPEGWPYKVPSELRARLLDLGKNEILWEGICSLPGGELHTPQDSVTSIHEKLRLAADVCADKLSAPFTVGNK